MAGVQNLHGRGAKSAWRGSCHGVQNLHGVVRKKKKNAIIENASQRAMLRGRNKKFVMLGRCYYSMNKVSKTQYLKAPVLDKVNMSACAWSVWTGLCSFARWKIENGVYVHSIEGSCFPSKDLLALRCHMSERSVRNGIKELEQLRLVTSYPDYGKAGRRKGKGMQKSNQYVLYPQCNAPISADERQENMEKVQEWMKAQGWARPDSAEAV